MEGMVFQVSLVREIGHCKDPVSLTRAPVSDPTPANILPRSRNPKSASVFMHGLKRESSLIGKAAE